MRARTSWTHGQRLFRTLSKRKVLEYHQAIPNVWILKLRPKMPGRAKRKGPGDRGYAHAGEGRDIEKRELIATETLCDSF